MPLEGSILLLGGAGTLGRAIIKRSIKEKWDCKISIFSRDPMKHHRVKQMFPNVTSILGDICDYQVLRNAMIDKVYVLHLAANKHIPDSEIHSIDTIRVNVTGTLAVAEIALELSTPHVLCISTDKAAHPANLYGATKMMDEKIFQEYARIAKMVGSSTQFHLVRYGNVLESTGSVIEVWKNQMARKEPIKITDLDMTRFYISPSQAVDLVLSALETPSGHIFIPKMKALSIRKLVEYTIGWGEIGYEIIPIRPGEKTHETLLTKEEGWYASERSEYGEFDPINRVYGDYFILKPTTSERYSNQVAPYTSDIADQLTQDELTNLLNDDHG